ncbi:MAG: hypothetical protein R3321_05115 [Nitrososphaeraceae archaeon]|nr:hypothetical protein [Nitrososphaeraceae archaeon]
MPKSTRMVTTQRQVGLQPFIFLFLCIGIIGAWLLDLSTTALMNDLVLFNGLWVLSPALGYHIGLFCIMASIAINAAIGFHTTS